MTFSFTDAINEGIDLEDLIDSTHKVKYFIFCFDLRKDQFLRIVAIINLKKLLHLHEQRSAAT